MVFCSVKNCVWIDVFLLFLCLLHLTPSPTTLFPFIFLFSSFSPSFPLLFTIYLLQLFPLFPVFFPTGGKTLGSNVGPVPIIRLYGVTRQGRSVMASIHGFTPYFYVSLPPSADMRYQIYFLESLKNFVERKLKLKVINVIYTCMFILLLMCVYTHTHTNTNTHTYTHSLSHVYIHTCTHIHRTHTHTYSDSSLGNLRAVLDQRLKERTRGEERKLSVCVVGECFGYQ